ncbi:hypothetical protein R3W88_026847 [Solanum pinnatisectum]|uniref:Uncharacterized protein n=1 Tax=Solanum pinnatisectum TaxID=50273 RepID=A0AAV9LF23_9SOLN|nr:hypothetical protein R3W88_026847 [Solanum pinnatisectum]
MTFEIEVEVTKDDDEIEVTRKSQNATEKEVDITQKVVPMPRPPPQFPQRLEKKTEEGKYHKFISMLKQISINVPLIEALEQMLGYAKFMKDLKKKDPDAFTIPCTIGLLYFAKTLCDLGASINLIPLSIYKKLGLGDPKSTAMRFLMVDFEVSIILGRPFLATGCALVDMEKGQMKFRLNNEEVTFNICKSMKQSNELKSASMVNHMVESGSEVPIEEMLGVDSIAVVMMNFEGDGIEDYDELVAVLDSFKFHSKKKRLELDMKNRDSPLARLSVEEALKLELKALPSHLNYVFLGKNGTLPVIIVTVLNMTQIEALVFVLKRFKRAIG